MKDSRKQVIIKMNNKRGAVEFCNKFRKFSDLLYAVSKEIINNLPSLIEMIFDVINNMPVEELKKLMEGEANE